MTVPLAPPPPPSRHTGRRTFLVWVIALATIIVYENAEPILERFRIPTAFLGFLSFLASLILIAITLYWIAAASRWLLRKLFFRVGRRLLLSYILIGGLPFILMTILLLAITYMIGGVMSHAALRGERQATLGQMESWALEYGLTGQRPVDALKTLEIFDTETGAGEGLPEWLQRTTFSGMVWRNDQPLLVTSRQFAIEGSTDRRTVVFVQPLDRHWAEQLEDKGGMVVSWDEMHEEKTSTGRNYQIKEETGLKEVFKRGGPDGIFWADPSYLNEWETGETNRNRHLVTFIWNPVRNLFQFYFGAAYGRYVRFLGHGILVLLVMLLLIYAIAALFAAVLIFSISRAVNRIERGTKAVERGDFSYRINMKPHNQLGEMAQSFDRMTASIASLLITVAEKERLQSEIEIAATIQRNLLPKEGPRFRGISFSAHFEPTASIGGDYYDVFNLDKSRLAVAIGDVSGHGLSTGLVMAMVKAAITTLVEEGADETSLFHRLNELVYRSTERRAFMTLAFTIFDLEHGTIRHTNAGHLYPYLLRKGEPPHAIESPSLPLGVRHDIVSRTVELSLQEGDAIVYLSDGIVEAQNESGDPWGFDQLEQLLAGETERSPDAIRDTILEAVAVHCGTRPADDDRTVMVLRFDSIKAALMPVVEVEETAAVA